MKGDSQNLCRISDGIRIFPSYTKSVSLSSWICCHVIPIYSYTFPTITSANFEYNVRTPSTDYAWNHVFSMNTTYYSLIITNSVTRKEYIASRKLRSFFCIFATKRAPPVTSAYGTLFWSLRSVVFVADTKAQFFFEGLKSDYLTSTLMREGRHWGFVCSANQKWWTLSNKFTPGEFCPDRTLT